MFLVLSTMQYVSSESNGVPSKRVIVHHHIGFLIAIYISWDLDGLIPSYSLRQKHHAIFYSSLQQQQQ